MLNLTLCTLRKFLKYCAVSALVVLATNSVVGNFYFQGGVAYWPDYSLPPLTTAGIPVGSQEEANVVRNTDLWIGAGYTLGDQWSVEAFFSRLPSTEVFSRFNVYYQGIPIEPNTGSITLYTETVTVGVGAVYEISISDRLSLIGKVGVAFAQDDSDLDIFFPRVQIPIDPEDFDDFDESDLTFDDIGGFNLDDEDDTTLDAYFAVGVRIPIEGTLASVTATYQFVNTSENTESGLFLGLRWDI